MGRRVEFEGRVQEFPDDATDDEIRSALETSPPAPATAPAEKPGFFSGVGQGSSLLQAAAHPIDTINALTNQTDLQEAARLYRNGDLKGAATKMIQWSAMGGPIPIPGVRLIAGTIEGQKGKLDQARDAYKRGDYGAVFKNLTQAAVPPAAQAVEGAAEIARGNPGYGAGLIGGNILDFITPAAGKGVARGAKAAAAGAKGAVGAVAEAALSPTGRDVIGMISPRAGRAVDAVARVKQGVEAIEARRAAPAQPPALPVPAPQAQSGPPPLPAQPPSLPVAVQRAPAPQVNPVAAPPVESTIAPSEAVPQAESVIHTIPFANEAKQAAVGATKKSAAQAVKAQRLSEKLFADGTDRRISSQDAARFTRDDWKMLAKDMDITAPSDDSIAQTIKNLRDMEDASAMRSRQVQKLKNAKALPGAEELAALLQ